MSRVQINYEENVALLKAAPYGTPLCLDFGMNRVYLQDIPQNHWAFKLLEEMRNERSTVLEKGS